MDSTIQLHIQGTGSVITSAELQMLLNTDNGATLPGIDTTTGNLISNAS